MFSPRLILPWRERLRKNEEEVSHNSSQKKSKHLTKLRENVQHLAIKVFEQKEKTDRLKETTKMSRMHDICENGRNHFLTKSRLNTIAEMAVNPADRELFARLYSRVDNKIWNISETRSWYDNVWQPVETTNGRCSSAPANPLSLSLPSYRNASRQRPTRAHTARSTQGRNHMQVSTHFNEAWSSHVPFLETRAATSR